MVTTYLFILKDNKRLLSWFLQIAEMAIGINWS